MLRGLLQIGALPPEADDSLMTQLVVEDPSGNASWTQSSYMTAEEKQRLSEMAQHEELETLRHTMHTHVLNVRHSLSDVSCHVSCTCLKMTEYHMTLSTASIMKAPLPACETMATDRCQQDHNSPIK